MAILLLCDKNVEFPEAVSNPFGSTPRTRSHRVERRDALRLVHAHTFNAIRGGSDVMYSDTLSLLRLAGHDIRTIERDASRIRGIFGHVWADAVSLHSPSAQREMRELLSEFRPQVVHLHNPYPLLSPSVIIPCRSAGIPVVMALHDYFLSCPTGHLYRNDSTCELCFGGHEYRCITTRCTGSYVGSATLAIRTVSARLRRVFLDNVNVFTVPSRKLRQTYVAEGLPASRIAHLPNCVAILESALRPEEGSYVAFVGRVSAEKGIATLLEAGRLCRLPLRIAGQMDGTIRPKAIPDNVKFVGHLPRAEIAGFLGGARYVVVPSICAEVASLSALEAMAAGLPVIASRIGGLPESVPEAAGVLVPPGDPVALADAMTELWHDAQRLRAMGAAGREHVRLHHSEEAYYRQLIVIYSSLATVAPAAASN
jgi:glycosyltransferase involved in cell wall biosynthesis